MNILNSETFHNLARSFAGESQARNRYHFMEYGARQNGLSALADVIQGVAKNEFHHARMFYTYITKFSDKEIKNIEFCAGYPFKERWDILENLRIASEDEASEATVIYPKFAQIADKEGFAEAAALWRKVIQVEECHSKLFKQLYTQMKNGTMYKREQPVKWKCGDCGFEAVTTQAWEKCPLCQAKQGDVLLKIEDEV